MAITPNIRPFIVDTIKQHLEDVFGDSLKAYFIGDPILVASEQMPCVIIHKASGDTSFGPTGMDEATEEIIIEVVCDKKVELGNPDPESTGTRKLMELVEGRDATTGQYLDNSIMGVLRKNATLGNVIVNQVLGVEYSTNMRGEDSYTEEATVRFRGTEFITVTNRS